MPGETFAKVSPIPLSKILKQKGLCADGYASGIATGLCVEFLLKRVAILGSLVQRELPRKRVRDCPRFTIPPPPLPRLRRAELGTSLYTREAVVSANNAVIPPYGLCNFPPNGAANYIVFR